MMVFAHKYFTDELHIPFLFRLCPYLNETRFLSRFILTHIISFSLVPTLVSFLCMCAFRGKPL